MSDLIKREDAIKALCDSCGWKESQCDQDEGFWCESGALIRRDIPSADRPQEWIPCSERLPRPYTEVLVCDECGWISLGSYRPCDVTEKDSGWSTHTRIKMPTDGIYAWMPLPKPWKGADDE